MDNSRCFKLRTDVRKILVDTVTPVSLYLRLRDQFPQSLLLESSDSRGAENSWSFICCKPLATFRVQHATIDILLPDGSREERRVGRRDEVELGLERFRASFAVPECGAACPVSNGIFGYSAYDAVAYFETIDLKAADDAERRIPDLCYSLFEYLFAINHYKNEMYVVRTVPDCCASPAAGDWFDELRYYIHLKELALYPFAVRGAEESNFSDGEYLDVIKETKKHIQRGDIFQIVPSRRFSQRFKGDEFNVYRALRSINPSPYLFYFDYGSFKLFGSSPEAQLVVRNGKAVVHPIAGTYRRTGAEEEDLRAAVRLQQDPKENAEHVMLVDLARNDLSKHCSGVRVESFREIQHYSHVIHLVSRVAGQLMPGKSAVSVLADTFPAGTLSGAPKYRAMELIDRFERGRRGFYGGAIGFFGFNGDCNHAIMIRSFLSKDNVLYSQAGGGVVADSMPEAEVQEAKNKLLALKGAVKMAEEL